MLFGLPTELSRKEGGGIASSEALTGSGELLLFTAERHLFRTY